MLNKTKPSHGNRAARAARPALAALALMLGGMSLQAVAQQLPAPAERWCTSGYNSTYGWFFHNTVSDPECDECTFGVWEVPGMQQNVCEDATPAKLRLRWGNSAAEELPLVGNQIYRLDQTPPRLELGLLEPALCEDYGVPGTGSSGWKLYILDANNEYLLSQVNGVNSLDYLLGNPSSGVLQPQGQGTNVKLQCYSGLAKNAPLPSDDGAGNELGPDDIFIDGMESPPAPPSGVDLRVWFPPDLNPGLNVTNNDDVLTQGADNDAQILVRVQNFGTVAAQNVWVREFVPTSSDLLRPTVERNGCVYNDFACAGGVGQGTTPLRLNVGQLGAAGSQNDSRDILLTRHSQGEVGANKPQALIQVAAFAENDVDHSNNSRALRIKVVNQVQITRQVWTNGTLGSAGGSITINQSLPSGCSDSQQSGVTTCQPGTSGSLQFTATASNPSSDNGYSFTGFEGCGVTETPESPTGQTVSISVPSADCTLKANFKKKPKVSVTNTPATGMPAAGTVQLNPASGVVHVGGNVTLQVSNIPDGWQVDEVEGTPTNGCSNIQLQSPNTWEIGGVQNDCGVIVTYKVRRVTIQTVLQNNQNGTEVGDSWISPGMTVNWGTANHNFDFMPMSPYVYLNSEDNCGENGGPAGHVTGPNPVGGYTYVFSTFGGGVKPAGDTCTVTVTLEKITHTVGTSVIPENGSGGDLELDDNGVVGQGDSIGFSINPNTEDGYYLVPGSVEITGPQGTCGSVLYNEGDDKWTAGPITGPDCTIHAEFSNLYEVEIRLQRDEQGNPGGEIGIDENSMGVSDLVLENVVYNDPGVYFYAKPDSGIYNVTSLTPDTCNAGVAGVITNGYKFRVTNPGVPQPGSGPKGNCVINMNFHLAARPAE